MNKQILWLLMATSFIGINAGGRYPGESTANFRNRLNFEISRIVSLDDDLFAQYKLDLTNAYMDELRHPDYQKALNMLVQPRFNYYRSRPTAPRPYDPWAPVVDGSRFDG